MGHLVTGTHFCICIKEQETLYGLKEQKNSQCMLLSNAVQLVCIMGEKIDCLRSDASGGRADVSEVP